MANPTFDETEPLFDETTPVEAPQRADPRAEFEAGNPRANRISDTPVMDVVQPVLTRAKNVAQATTNMLPMAGALFGGSLGAGAAGVGAFPGAAIGGATGAAARNLINTYVFGEKPKDFVEGLTDAAVGSVEGVSQEMGGALLNKATGVAVQVAKAVAQNSVVKAVGNVAKNVAQDVAAFGAKFKVPGMQRLSAVIGDDASTATARVALKARAKIAPMLKATGQKIGAGWKAVDDVIDDVESTGTFHQGAQGTGTPGFGQQVRYTVAQTRNMMEREISEGLAATGKPKPAGFYDDLKSIMDEWFSGYKPDQILKAQELHKLLVAMEDDVGLYTSKVVNPNTAKGITKTITNSGRNLLNQYAQSTGDATLVEHVTNLNQSYAALKKAKRILDIKLAPTDKRAVVEQGLKRVAWIMSQGDKLGPKYSTILFRASQRGLAAAMQTHARLRQSDEKYNEIIEQLDQEGSNGSGQ